MADIKPLQQNTWASATTTFPTKKVCVQYLDVAEEACSSFQTSTVSPTNASVYIPREELNKEFPGVLFEGDSISIERGVLIAPGSIVRAFDNAGWPAKVVIEGETVLGNGVFIQGNVELKNTQIQGRTKIVGSVHIENSKIGPALNIDGNRINIYASVIEDSIIGTNVVLVQSTLEKGGSIIGSYVTLYPETTMDKPITGSYQHIDGSPKTP